MCNKCMIHWDGHIVERCWDCRRADLVSHPCQRKLDIAPVLDKLRLALKECEALKPEDEFLKEWLGDHIRRLKTDIQQLDDRYWGKDGQPWYRDGQPWYRDDQPK